MPYILKEMYNNGRYEVAARRGFHRYYMQAKLQKTLVKWRCSCKKYGGNGGHTNSFLYFCSINDM